MEEISFNNLEVSMDPKLTSLCAYCVPGTIPGALASVTEAKEVSGFMSLIF